MMAELYSKYIIIKTDGSPIDEKADYFVLRLDTDPAAREAMLKYAEIIRSKNEEFSKEIEDRVWNYMKKTRCPNCNGKKHDNLHITCSMCKGNGCIGK